MKRLILYVAVLVCAVGQVEATELTFDFDSGMGPNFWAHEYSNELFSVDTDGPDIRIHKEADDGSYRSTGWLQAGIQSNFFIDGDFSITVDFALNDWPEAEPNSNQLNESLLAVIPEGRLFEVLRFRLGHQDRVEVFAKPEGVVGGTLESSLTGRYRIERSGSTATGLFAPVDSSVFTTIGSIDNLTGPVRVQLFAAQGKNAPDDPRSTTSLDISFDNLIIQADTVTGLVPEPSAIILLLTGALGFIAYGIRRRGL